MVQLGKFFACILPLFAGLATISADSWHHLGDVQSFELDGSNLNLSCKNASVRISAMSNHVVRVRLAPEGTFGRDFSWAVTGLNARGSFKWIDQGEDRLVLATGSLNVIVHRTPCRIEVQDAEGNVLTADDPRRGLGWRSAQPTNPPSTPVRVWQQLPDGVAIYGLGEKTGGLNKRGRSWTNWNSDRPGYRATTDPIYKSVPFYIAATEGRYHGVFFDNPWRTHFDFAERQRNILTFGAEGGELNYYVIAGPNPKDVVSRYSDLTGRIELPPLWTLGYHQCRYSYYPESRVREIAHGFRSRKIPCDVIYFDIDYMDGYRCFTWNKERFADPKALTDDLHDMGFHTIAIIDPGIKNEAGYDVFDQGSKIGAWLTKPDGQSYVGRVWPGESVFPDFSNPAVRDWWSNLFPPFLSACGIDGIWNDMNEPADFVGPNHSVPLDLIHDNEGDPESHLACHNIYGMQMARATLEGIKRANPDRRAFTMTRATYAGGQRFGASWTGDNVSSWEHLQMSIPMVLNMGVSGLPFTGPDIGGFSGGPTPELYARWIQVGSLFPYCRTHTAWDNPDQEPWSFGPQVEAIARDSLNLRYRLLPYIYTLFEEASRTGVPIMRPLWLEYPSARGGHLDEVFMLGPHLYVVPTLNVQAGEGRTHWLPDGIWFDFNTGEVHASGQPVPLDSDLGTMPMFVRAGAIIPTQSLIQHTEQIADEPLIIDVWPSGDSEYSLYEDDGISESYRSGQYRRTHLRCKASGAKIEFTMQAPEGSYVPPPRSPLLRLHGLTKRIAGTVCIDASVQASASSEQIPTASADQPTKNASSLSPADFSYDEATNTWVVRMLPDSGKTQHVLITLTGADRSGAEPPAFHFNEPGADLAFRHGFMPPRYADGTVHLTVQAPWDPYVVLPRMKFQAKELPILHLRLATQSASKLQIRWATEENPRLGDEPAAMIDLQPGGELHDYTLDLSKRSPDRWDDTVYWLRLDFEENVRHGEVIVIDEIAFKAP